MPLLYPLIIGGAGMLGLGATAGVAASDGAAKMAEAIKWATLAAVGAAAIFGTIYLVRKT